MMYKSSGNLLLAFVGLLGLLCLEVALATEKVGVCDLNRIRLPDHYSPKHYEIKIVPDLDKMTFTGEVEIEIVFQGSNKEKCESVNIGALLGKAAKAAFPCFLDNPESIGKRIILNVGALVKVNKAEVVIIDDERRPQGADLSRSICHDDVNEMVAIVLATNPKVGQKLNVKLWYDGQIGTESRGYYQSSHTDPITKKTFTNTNTHFFPADARSAFPSFDEPDFKASFDLTIVHKNNLVAISNADFAEKITLDDTIVTKFKTTPVMSTYNFAFAVGTYELKTCNTDKTVRAWLPTGYLNDFPGKPMMVLDTICKSIGVSQEFFAHPFPLDKLDLVLTKTMSAPSRENWGMLVITEDFFLTDENTSNVLRVEIAKLASHITLHQWWGDLITAKWWDDQWIFDGFTIWQSHWIADKLYPEFSYDFNYLLRLQSAMLDSHATDRVHPIKSYQQLTANKELELFDTNTFNKAGALYQMMSSINPEKFRAGLQKLLKEHLYSTADANDWFKTMGQALGLSNMEPMMRSWLDQAGFPLIDAKLTADGKLELSQTRFLENSNGASKELWHVPIQISLLSTADSGKSEQLFVILDKKSDQFDLPRWFDAANDQHYVKLNSQFNGFYRVQYSDNLLKRLEVPIKDKLVSAADRFNLVDDYKALLKGGRVGLEEFEQVLSWYENENRGGVLSGLAATIPVLSAAHKKAGKTAEATAQIVYNLFRQLSMKSRLVISQDHATMNGNQDALLALVAYKHQQTIKVLLNSFDVFGPNQFVAPYKRRPMYLAVVNFGSDAQFEQLIQRLLNTWSLYERNLIVQVLSAYSTNAERTKQLAATLKAPSAS